MSVADHTATSGQNWNIPESDRGLQMLHLFWCQLPDVSLGLGHVENIRNPFGKLLQLTQVNNECAEGLGNACKEEPEALAESETLHELAQVQATQADPASIYSDPLGLPDVPEV